MHRDVSELKAIQEHADIVEIISSYIPLESKGKNYFGVCPFHEDHSPSMSVSRSKGIYKCFSCGATGNVFKFVSDYENISFYEAVQKVANKIGMPFKGNVEIAKTPKKYQKEYEIMELSSLFFQNNLMTEEGSQAFSYLKDRGMDETVIEDFQIGLSLDKNSLHSFLNSKKYDISLLQSLGLVNQNEFSVYDTFVHRVMFPIHNLNGEVVGFTGRIYLPDSSPPKYMNSKETIIFKKGEILFNYHRARENIRMAKKLLIVEGNMDAIRMYSCGLKNVVALMGTSLTDFQIKEIKKLRVPVVLILDNDDAGLLATYQVGQLLFKEQIIVQVVRISGEKDPDDYILKHGIAAMENNVKNAISFLEFKLSYLKRNKNLQDSEELALYIKNILQEMAEESDDILKEVTLKKLSDDYGLSMEVLKQELLKFESSRESITLPSKEVVLEGKEKSNKYDFIASHILYFMMNDPVYIKMYKSKLGFLETSLYRGIANEIMAYYELHKTINLADFLTVAELSPLKNEIFQVVESIMDENMDETIMDEYIFSIKQIRRKNEIAKLKEKMRMELDPNKKLEYACRIQSLKKEV